MARIEPNDEEKTPANHAIDANEKAARLLQAAGLLSLRNELPSDAKKENHQEHQDEQVSSAQYQRSSDVAHIL